MAQQEWVTIACCGSWKDSRIQKHFDEQFGEGNWRTGYTWDGNFISIREGITIYEDAYYEYLSKDKEMLKWLIITASDVYDTAPSNVNSGLDYNSQEVDGAAQHWQDISIRRVLKRMELNFQGDHLVEIRGYESEGYRLNPGRLPFHKPEMIATPRECGTWWKKDSIEDFSISNIVIQVPLLLALQWVKSEGATQPVLRSIVLSRNECLIDALVNAIGEDAKTSERVALFIERARVLSGRCASSMVDWNLGDLLIADDAAVRKEAIQCLNDERLLRVALEDPARKARAMARSRLDAMETINSQPKDADKSMN